MSRCSCGIRRGQCGFLYNVIVIEESSRVGNSGFFISLHNDVIAPYITTYANEEQKNVGCLVVRLETVSLPLL